MKVEQVMTRTVHTCRADQTLNDAARIFWDHDCGTVPVVDADGKLVGMLTDRDVCMSAYFRGDGLRNLWIGDAMARRVLSTRPEDALEEALDLMRTHQIRRLPVVDGDGRVQGILSLSDLFRASASSGEVKPKKLVRTLAAICGSQDDKRAVVIDLDLELRPADKAIAVEARPARAPKKPNKKLRVPAKRGR
jgi:CBS domain-containing protein